MPFIIVSVMIQIKIFELLSLYTHKLGKLHKGSKITSINLLAYLKVRMGDFSQDGGGSRYILLPHTTKRRTTTNSKTKTTRTARKSSHIEVQQPRNYIRNTLSDW